MLAWERDLFGLASTVAPAFSSTSSHLHRTLIPSLPRPHLTLTTPVPRSGRLDPLMMKSRTAVSRTFAKVKTRISSFGSLVSTTTESPNPLLAPPPALLDARSVSITPTFPTIVSPDPHPPGIDGTISPNLSPSPPPIAALKIATESWTVFNAHPKYHATAYVKFTISCIAQTAGVPLSFLLPSSTDAGHLHTLLLSLSLTGPGITLSHYGNVTHSSLHPNVPQNKGNVSNTDPQWISVMHIGIKDNSLASKLTTSFRSFGRSASRSARNSAGKLGRYTNIDLINKWLSILESDTDGSDANEHDAREPVVVHAAVKYKHSLLPETTELRDKMSCRVKMTREEMERGVITGVEFGMGGKRINKETGEGGRKREEIEEDEDEYEERLREMRVLGAPWL